jgi:hypothetical protein
MPCVKRKGTNTNKIKENVLLVYCPFVIAVPVAIHET